VDTGSCSQNPREGGVNDAIVKKAIKRRKKIFVI